MSAAETVRLPAVAGAFYPGRPDALRREVDGYLSSVDRVPGAPKAIVVPHAGYAYSGPIAASAYATLRAAAHTITRVVLLGPAHFVPLHGLAVPTVDAFLTPLGAVPVDLDARAVALGLPGVVADAAAHAPEHSLEVQLPFLQRSLREFRALPIVVGRADEDTVATVLDALWGGPETLIVVSTDLSHYLDYASARVRDRRTADAIVACAASTIAPNAACGGFALRGLLVAARRRNAVVRLLDLRSSGDTAGPRDRVVGYGAFTVEAT